MPLSSLLAERDDAWQLVVSTRSAATKYRYAFPSGRGPTEPVETIRSKRDAVRVTLYRTHGPVDSHTLGWASVDLAPNEPLDTIRSRLSRAAAAADAQRNPAFRFTEPSAYPALELWDPALADPEPAIRGFVDVARAAAAEEGVNLSLAELTVHATVTGLSTSNGIAAQEAGTLADIELDFVTPPAGKAVRGQAHPELSYRTFCGLDIAALARDYARRATEAARAQPMPNLGPHTPVVLADEAVANFFAPAGSIFASNPYLSHADARTLYQGESYLVLGAGICRKRAPDGRFVVDEDIQGNTFTLISDAALPMAVGSAVFSRIDAVPGQRVTIIDNGAFVHPIGDTVFFEYLRATDSLPAGLRPTGPRGTIIVEPHGRLRPAADLLVPDGKPLLVVYQWASFAPENNSGNMSVQVRYGTIIEPDGSRYPVINGIVSGNYFEMAKRLHASEEQMATGTYRGPSHVRFEDLTVASD